jgi:hypothetical protein
MIEATTSHRDLGRRHDAHRAFRPVRGGERRTCGEADHRERAAASLPPDANAARPYKMGVTYRDPAEVESGT